MVGKMLAASAALLLVVGVTVAADKKAGPDQVTGKFVKFDADKNEITITVKKENMTYPLAKDAKVAVGEVKGAKDLGTLKANTSVTLTLKTEGTKTWVTTVMEAKSKSSKSSGSVSPSGSSKK